MRIIEGCKYLTRDGRKVGPIRRVRQREVDDLCNCIDRKDYWAGRFSDDGLDYGFRKGGNYYDDGTADHDLIAPDMTDLYTLAAYAEEGTDHEEADPS